MNTTPKFRDKSGAIYDRIIIIPFTKRIRDTKLDDKNLDKKILQEDWKSHIVNVALYGLKRLLDQPPETRNFTNLKASDDAIKEYEMVNNPIARFVNEYDITTESGLYKSDVFELYLNWYENNKIGKNPLDSQSLSKAIKELGYDDHLKTISTNPKKRERSYFKISEQLE